MNGDQDDESVAPQRHFLFCPTQKPDKPLIPPKPPKESSKTSIKTSLKSIKSLTKSATRQGSKSNTKSKEKTVTKESKTATKESKTVTKDSSSKKNSSSDTKTEKLISSKPESKRHHHHKTTSKPKPDSQPESKPDPKKELMKLEATSCLPTIQTSSSKITLNRQRSNPFSTLENSQSSMMRRGNAHELLKRRETAPGGNSPATVRKDAMVSHQVNVDQVDREQSTKNQVSTNQFIHHQFNRQVSDPNDVTPVNSPKPVRSRKISTVMINLARSPPPVRMPKPVFEKFKNDMKVGNFGEIVQNVEVMKIGSKTTEQNEMQAKTSSKKPPKLNLTGLSNLSALPKNMTAEIPSEAPEPKSPKTPKDKKSKCAQVSK